VCEYIANCVECMRLLMYKSYQVNSGEPTNQTPREKPTISVKFSQYFSRFASCSFHLNFGINLTKKIGMAILSESKLVKRFTLQIERLISTQTSNQDQHDDDWQFRDAVLKCLYSKDLVQCSRSLKTFFFNFDSLNKIEKDLRVINELLRILETKVSLLI
jgi:hypothetical protein